MNTEFILSAHATLTKWETINWSEINSYVKKLRQRIYSAEQLGKTRKVRKLQRLMLISKANLLLSIKQVTQVNKGKRTAGVDGYKALKPSERITLFNKIVDKTVQLHKPSPAKRVYIHKKNGKLRPLGIPTIIDRTYQNVVKNALEPQWEYRFEPCSYGFRPGRGTHDAIENIFTKVKSNTKKKWVFEGDFRACFDNLNHEHINEQLRGFSGKKIISKWLEAGYVDNKTFHMTDSGTMQGGPISPLLANIALRGMEKEIGIERNPSTGQIKQGCGLGLVIYADDFVILTETREKADEMYENLKPYLNKRGLELSKEKTKITHIEEGFNFLGFNIRQYRKMDGNKLLIKPNRESVKKAKDKIRTTFEELKGHEVSSLISIMNPIIRGYANYWKPEVSKEIFGDMDNYIFTKVVKHLKRLHPMKSWKWKAQQYFKKPNQGGSNTKWILTCPKTNIQLLRMSWTKIERHIMVKQNNTPDDPKLKEYWEKRKSKKFDNNNTMDKIKLASKQKYKCPFCKEHLQNDTDETVEAHHKKSRSDGGTDEYKNIQLMHTSCHIQYHQLKPS